MPLGALKSGGRARGARGPRRWSTADGVPCAPRTLAGRAVVFFVIVREVSSERAGPGLVDQLRPLRQGRACVDLLSYEPLDFRPGTFADDFFVDRSRRGFDDGDPSPHGDCRWQMRRTVCGKLPRRVFE